MRSSFILRASLCCSRPQYKAKLPTMKEMVEQQMEVQQKAMGKVAIYPHHVMTRSVLECSAELIKSGTFVSSLLELRKTAADLRCISFSAPKAHWDAAVLLVKSNPDQAEFEVWVNPQVPGYDDRNSAAAMYGMWENCISCGAVHAWVLRPQRITCKGLDEFGKEKCEVLDGMRARCFMHELDHIKGKTIIQRALDPEFVVSGISMSQKDLWPANFPSAEAYVTPPLHFFDYVTNQVVVPKGMEWWCGQEASPSSQHFHNQRINQ